MIEVTRYDRANVLAPRVTEEGFLLVTADFAKPGVMAYRHADGSVTRELLPEEELHDADSLATLALKPVTLEHPRGNVTPETHADTSVGSTGEIIEVVREGGYARVKLVVRDREAIDAVRGGKVEVSPGYRVQLDSTPGVHPVFGAYDAVQRRRRYNHLALVDQARGGPDIRLHLDSALAIGDDDRNSTQEGPMPRALFLALLAAAAVAPADVVKADAKDTDPVTEEEVAALGAAIAKRDSAGLKAAFDALMGQYDTMARQAAKKDGELEALKAQVAALEAAKAAKAAAGGEAEGEENEDMCGPKMEALDKGDGLAVALAWSARRSALLGLAGSRGIQIEKADSLGNAEIARAVAKGIRPDLRADASDEYVAALIDLTGTAPAPKVVDPYAAFAFDPPKKPENRGDSKDRQPEYLSEVSANFYRGSARA